MMVLNPADTSGTGRSSAPAATSPAGSSARHALVVIRGPQQGMRIPITNTPMRIGRHHNCEIRLDGHGVSVFHAEIRSADDGQYLLLDTGSLTGTKVNRTPITCRTLSSGDEIRVGTTHLVFDQERSDSTNAATSVDPATPTPRSAEHED